jgi:hypothetical protein
MDLLVSRTRECVRSERWPGGAVLLSEVSSLPCVVYVRTRREASMR